MAEPIHDKEKKEPELRPKQIHIHDVQELRYWTRTLGVSSDILVSAVRAVGSDPARVEEYVRRLRAS